jgi:hypothetical protein
MHRDQGVRPNPFALVVRKVKIEFFHLAGCLIFLACGIVDEQKNHAFTMLLPNMGEKHRQPFPLQVAYKPRRFIQKPGCRTEMTLLSTSVLNLGNVLRTPPIGDPTLFEYNDMGIPWIAIRKYQKSRKRSKIHDE